MIQSYFNVAVNSQVFQLLNYYSWIVKWSYFNVAVNSQVFLLSNQKSNLRNWMEHADCNLSFFYLFMKLLLEEIASKTIQLFWQLWNFQTIQLHLLIPTYKQTSKQTKT
jgi:hypothetical protein